MDIKGYYKTLGVSENATPEEIKKAYRQLALKYHPDRWATASEEEKKKAEEEFKKVAEAYDTLGDEQKKQQYDSGYGSNDDIFGSNSGGFDPFDILRRAGFTGFGGGGFNPFTQGGRNIKWAKRGEDIETNVTLTFKESVEGVNKEVIAKRKVECPDCNGTGSEDKQEHKCSVCNGTGTQTFTQRMGNSFSMTQGPCQNCHGTGRVIEHKCVRCNGTGYIYQDHHEDVHILAGVQNGMRIAFQGLGNEGENGGPNGDLIINVRVTQKLPGYFKTEGLNVVHTEEINFVDALLGTKFVVDTPDGHEWEVNAHECTQPGEEYKIANGGYPDPNNQIKKGDYIVRIKYNVPSSLTKEQKKLLKNFKEKLL